MGMEVIAVGYDMTILYAGTGFGSLTEAKEHIGAELCAQTDYFWTDTLDEEKGQYVDGPRPSFG